MEPLVTIAIPTYNRAESYLPQAIQSALNQTYSNIEILVSDNCSTDNTAAVVKSFNDPRIKFFQQEKNIGSNNNANFCLAQATGKFFLLFFDDDQIDSDFIEVCMKAMNKGNDNAGVVFTGAREIDSKGNILFECPNQGIGLSTEEFFLAWFEGKVPLYFCSTLFNTKKLREIGGLYSKTNMYEDVVAEIRLSKMFGSITIRDVKASYRRHGHNMGSSVPIRAWCEDSLFLLDVMCHLASEKKDLIRTKGKSYFCNKNYRLASKIQSPIKRWCSYWLVYKSFNFHSLPPSVKRYITSNLFYKLALYIKNFFVP